MTSQIEQSTITTLQELNQCGRLITENPESKNAPTSAPSTERIMGEFHLLELTRLFGPPIPRDIDHLPKEKEIIQQYGSNRERIEPYKKIPIFRALEMFEVTAVIDCTDPVLLVPNCAACCDRYQICEIHERLTSDTPDNTQQYMHTLRAIYLLIVNAHSLPCFAKFRKAYLSGVTFGFEKCCERRICSKHTPNLARLWDDVLNSLHESKKIPLRGHRGGFHNCKYSKGTCKYCRDHTMVNEFIGRIYNCVKETIMQYRYIDCVFEPGCHVPFKLNIKPPTKKLNPEAVEFKPSK